MNLGRIIISFSFFLFFSTTVFAQLSGTKTIGGTSPDYATFSAAATDLNTNGVNGAVIFNVAPGTYIEQFTLSNIVGTNSVNTITFQSSNGDSTSVIIQYASSSSAIDNYVVKLDGTDYITFKSLTITRPGTSSYSVVFTVVGASNDVHIENCIFKNYAINSTANAAALFYVPNGGLHSSFNQVFLNNRFVNGSIGIFSFGPSSNSPSTGMFIRGNSFENQGIFAMQLYYQEAPKVINNKVVSNTLNSNYVGLLGNYISKAFVFRNNKFILNKGTGLSLQASISNIQTGLITNNFISIASTSGKGIILNNSGYQNIYFNSIRMLGASAIGLKVTGSSSTANRFKNNIIQLDASGNCIETSNAPNAFNELNFNNYYFPNGNMGKYNTSTVYSTLATWQTATSKEGNSINVNPNFISNTDLHIINSAIALQGTSANTSPYSLTDIDGILRNTLTPDIGADEFTISDLAIDSVYINTQMCLGEEYQMKIDIKNESTAVINALLPVFYRIDTLGAIQLGLANIVNLAPDSIFSYIPINKINANSLGIHLLQVFISVQNDADSSNNVSSFNFLVSDYPISNLPNDTTTCGGKTMLLDPGAGYDSYLWYDGTTNPTYSLDSTGIGYGGKFISVSIIDNGCSIKDSALVLFKNCTGIENTSLKHSISIFPNPASEYISIDNQSSAFIHSMEIIRADGQLVRKVKTAGTNRIDISDLANGLYYLLIETEQGHTVKKFVKK
ncbi:MAG: T9SS type A sorting domain-containing protein [Bacteroidales bacterium]|nr:T9SS type A sorting domain-containing protein [Bacteroidales bacterium]